MARTQKTKSQSSSKKDNFEQVARDLGCDESDDALDKAFDSVEVKTDQKEEPDKDY